MNEHSPSTNHTVEQDEQEAVTLLRALVAGQAPDGDGYTRVCTLDLEAAERFLAEQARG